MFLRGRSFIFMYLHDRRWTRWGLVKAVRIEHCGQGDEEANEVQQSESDAAGAFLMVTLLVWMFGSVRTSRSCSRLLHCGDALALVS